MLIYKIKKTEGRDGRKEEDFFLDLITFVSIHKKIIVKRLEK